MCPIPMASDLHSAMEHLSVYGKEERYLDIFGKDVDSFSGVT